MDRIREIYKFNNILLEEEQPTPQTMQPELQMNHASRLLETNNCLSICQNQQGSHYDSQNPLP